MSVVDEQRVLALVRANEVRIAGAVERQRVKALSPSEGRVAVAELLEDPSDEVGAMRVGHLLTAIRRVGYGRVGSWLLVVNVRSADRRIRDLSVRQREVLAGLLRGYGGGL